MPLYRDIDTRTTEGRRTAEQLLALRQQLERGVPVERTLEETLLLATWNIREFDSPAYGDRLQESYYYIAEIISRFDLVAVQEVRKDLKALLRLMDVLGRHWRYLVTDVTEGEAGNEERMAFVYDSRKVRFSGLAGELVLPPVKVGTEYKPASQLARTPFMCGFTAGWSRFVLATVHIIYGEDRPDDPRRVEEIRQVAQFLKARTEDPAEWTQNLILLGDFNIYRPEDPTMAALLGAGFIVPDQIRALPSNAPRTKHYDQIAFRVQPDRLDFTGKAGAFNYYDSVFREGDEATYVPCMGQAYENTGEGQPRTENGKRAYYRSWRTHQMSDHLPLWVELKINYSDRYLQRKLSGDA